LDFKIFFSEKSEYFLNDWRKNREKLLEIIKVTRKNKEVHELCERYVEAINENEKDTVVFVLMHQ
jgi:hypothetical protein